MPDILDEFDKQAVIPELKKNWRELQIVLSVLLLIAGGVFLWFLITTYLSLNNSIWYSDLTTPSKFIRYILVPFSIPTAMIIGAVLLFFKKRLGWILSLSSSALISFYMILVGFLLAYIYPLLIVFTLLSCGFTVALFSKAYRNYYRFKTTDLSYIIGVPIVFVLILMFLR